MTQQISSKLKYPLVSIVILNYNGLKYGHLNTCITSVLRTNYPNFEVILVDNGSDDGSVDYVQKKFRQVKIIKLKKNYGTAIGYNIGAFMAKGKYVAILNNDVEVDPEWLTPLVGILEKIPNVVAADPKFKSYYYRDRFDDSAAAGRWIDIFGNNYTRGVNEQDLEQYNKLVYIMGVLTIFKKDILIKSGGFDPLYVFGYEDIDLAWRLYLMGYKIVYVPSSIIYHKSGGTTRGRGKKPKPGYYYLIKRNRLISIIKNYSIGNVLTALFFSLFEYILILIYFIMKKERRYSRDLFMAIINVFKNFRIILKRRYRVQSLRRVDDKYIRQYMLPYSGPIYELIYKIKNYIS